MKGTNLKITRLGPADTTRARANCALFWDMKDASANLAAYLSDPNCILLVGDVDGEPAGQIVGHILKRWDARRPMLFLYSIDIVATYRRKGIARRLLDEFLRLGKEAGCDSAFVLTNASNTPAMRLFEALGGTRSNPDDAMFEWQIAHEQDSEDDIVPRG